MSFFILIGGGGGDTTIVSTGLNVSQDQGAKSAQVAITQASVTQPSGVSVSVQQGANTVVRSGSINVEVD